MFLMMEVGWKETSKSDVLRARELRAYVELHVFSLTLKYYGTVYYVSYDFSNGFHPINAGEFKTEVEALSFVAKSIYDNTCRFCKQFDGELGKCKKDNSFILEDDHYDCIEKEYPNEKD